MDNELALEKQIVSDKNIFDFSIVTGGVTTTCIVWSEYNPEKDEEVKIYSSICDGAAWKETESVYKGNFTYPDIRITSGVGNKIHLLLGHFSGPFDLLNLITYNGKEWKQKKKITDIKTRTFGHNIVASQVKEEIYIVFGDYTERYYFPNIITLLLSGHVREDFGKLFLIKGDGTSWCEPLRITDKGRFSCKAPSVCLNDKGDLLHIVWVDERHGFREQAIYYDFFAREGFANNIKVSMDNQMVFSPIISCDQDDNIHIAWSTIEKDGLGRLYYRERKGGMWQDVVELSKRGVMNDLIVDHFGNVHFIWDDEHHVYYQTKNEKELSHVLTFDGQKARVCMDEKNDIHLALLRRQKKGSDSLIYKKLEKNKETHFP